VVDGRFGHGHFGHGRFGHGHTLMDVLVTVIIKLDVLTKEKHHKKIRLGLHSLLISHQALQRHTVTAITTCSSITYSKKCLKANSFVSQLEFFI